MKFCVSCGKQIKDESAFCPVCGAVQPGGVNQTQIKQPNMAPGQTSQGGYGQPQNGGYGQGGGFGQAPQGGNFGQQQNGGFQQGGFSQSQQGGYSQPQGGGFSQSQGGSFGQPQGGGFGQPQGGGFGQPSQGGGFGQPPRGGYGQTPQKPQKNMTIPILLAVIGALVVVAIVMLVLVKTDIISFNKDKEEKTVVEEITTEEASTEAEVVKITNDSSFEEFQAALPDRQKMNLRYSSADVTNYPTVKLYYTVEDESQTTLVLSNPVASIKEKVKNGQDVYRKVKNVEILRGNQGVSFDICADKSSSMEGNMSEMKSAMTEFVDMLDTESGDRAELISFDSYVMFMCTYTDDKTLLKNGINNMIAEGATALYDALYYGVMNAATREGARCVIAFTDGQDVSSTHTVDEVIYEANKYSVPIFIIYTSDGDSYTCGRIADETNGRSWPINSVSDMSEVLAEIYQMEKDMYCVEYESDTSLGQLDERNVECIMMDETYGSSDSSTFVPTEKKEVAQHSSRYEIFVEDISWTEANRKCMDLGGHLVTITSDSEMNTITQLCEGKKIKYCWMGGYTSGSGNATFGHWITGEDFESYTKWREGEPSGWDRVGDGEPEFYLMLWHPRDDEGWSWNDQRDSLIPEFSKQYSGNMGYVCEWED